MDNMEGQSPWNHLLAQLMIILSTSKMYKDPSLTCQVPAGIKNYHTSVADNGQYNQILSQFFELKS